MTKGIETAFKRVETKYIIAEEVFQDFLKDLKTYMKEDDYPTSTITNVYYDTPDFRMIQDALAKKYQREKVRMRTYQASPDSNSQAFLEIKQKDAEGVGHKVRLVSTSSAISRLMSQKQTELELANPQMTHQLSELKKRYPAIAPRMYIYYDRYSLKERQDLPNHTYNKIRITFDRNLIYRDYDVKVLERKVGHPLLAKGYLIMEIKAPGQKPQWLEEVLDRYGIEEMKFSKYAAAYHKSRGLPYEPRKANLERLGA